MKKRNKTNFFKKTSLIKKDRRGVAIEALVWWIIAIAVLVIVIVLAVVLRDKLGDIAGFIKNLFRFRK